MVQFHWEHIGSAQTKADKKQGLGQLLQSGIASIPINLHELRDIVRKPSRDDPGLRSYT